jgi:hypothetical protein
MPVHPELFYRFREHGWRTIKDDTYYVNFLLLTFCI